MMKPKIPTLGKCKVLKVTTVPVSQMRSVSVLNSIIVYSLLLVNT